MPVTDRWAKVLGQDREMQGLVAQVKSRWRERKGWLEAPLQGCFFPVYLLNAIIFNPCTYVMAVSWDPYMGHPVLTNFCIFPHSLFSPQDTDMG